MFGLYDPAMRQDGLFVLINKIGQANVKNGMSSFKGFEGQHGRRKFFLFFVRLVD